MGKSISQTLHIPVIMVDHVSRDCLQKLPLGGSVSVGGALELRSGDINVSLSENIKESWNAGDYGVSVTIPPYVKEHNNEEEKTLVVIDNNLPTEPLGIIERFTQEFGVVSRFPESDLNNLEKAKVYINTWNNIDIKTIEAMSLGCITISPRTPESSRVIEHGKNGLLFSDISEIPDLIRSCLSGEQDSIQNEAKRSVLEISCDEESFVKKWNHVLSYISESFFVRN